MVAARLELDRLAGRPLSVAFDGELRTMAPPLRFRVAPAALRLIKPAAGVE